MFLIIGRTFKEGMRNFLRNGWLSVATVSILMLSLYVVSVLYMVTVTASGLIKNIEEKASISVYFNSDVLEKNILEIKDKLEEFREIKSIEYISKEKALEDFKKNNADEPVIIQSLEELGENPLFPSLVVKAYDPNNYQMINDYIGKANFSENISRINYGKNKEIINKLNSIISTIKRVGVSLGALFAVVSILITFNAIRITIYAYRKEVEVMRLVGASNTFIRLPFIFEGMIYGVAASLSSMLILFVSAKFAAPYVSTAVPSGNLVASYLSHFWLLLGMQLAIGVLLGVVSSWVAMRKYLKI